MDTASNSNFFTSPAWHRFSAGVVRRYHAYAAWLVTLTWVRFFWYSLLLIALSGVLSHVPPFSLTYTETVTDSDDGHRRRAKAPKPAKIPKAPAAMPAPAMPPVELPAPATPAPPASGAASGAHKPVVEVIKSADGSKTKSININLPGVVVDGKGKGKATRHDGINISIGEDGIHIESVDKSASGSAAASAPAGERAVEMEVNGQHVRIVVPDKGDSEAVRKAVEEAREAIVEALKDAEEARHNEAEAAAEQASAEAAKAQEDMIAAMGEDTDNSPMVRTHRVSYGEDLPLLAFWWCLLSAILKVSYKGRLQAETKAAVLAETAEAESLRRQVIEARMAMMQAQVEPHFLFNTLASIDHLIEVDPKRASKMQRNLIALLRASMPTMREANDGGLRPLEREMAVIRPYLEILQVRMEERLTTSIDVPDGLNSAEFPPMMIQTLVENAIKHGLEPKPEGGSIAVKAEIRHGKLAVTVADTGLGFNQTGGATTGTGVGLANIRERLAMLYGTRAALTLADNPGGGTLVTITVPYTTRSAEGEPA